MPLRILSVLLIGSLFPSAQDAWAQGTSPKIPKKKDEVPPGYKKDVLHGFTLFVSDEVYSEDKKSKLDRTPLESLERELIIAEKVIPADKIRHLKNVPIWVEWDEATAMSNGRGGGAVAVFYGGHQAAMLAAGKPAGKANSVTILSLRSLADEHQPKTDSGRCVTLHELAHAYHFFVVSMENANVKATFQQAMERKLYDPKVYAATNDREYFAELTCAYLDSLHYAPRNREEMKKHDPKGFELMEKWWGRISEKKDPTAPVAKGPKLPSANGDGRFSLDLSTKQIKFGEVLSGVVPPKADWKGRPVLHLIWNIRGTDSQLALSKFAKLHEEYRDFQPRIFSALGRATLPDDVKKVIRQRDVGFAVLSDSDEGFPEQEFLLPHAFVYDSEGKCIFRGKPLDAEIYYRMAVGQSLVKKTGKTNWTKPAQTIVTSIEQGTPVTVVIAKIVEMLPAIAGESAAEVREILDVLTEGATKTVDDAKARITSDPVEAFFLLERIPSQYKGTIVAKQANEQLAKVREKPKVAAELRARPALDAIRKIDTQLSGKPLAFEPRHPDFREDNLFLLKQLEDAVSKMKKVHPEVKATQDAMKIAERWLVNPK